MGEREGERERKAKTIIANLTAYKADIAVPVNQVVPVTAGIYSAPQKKSPLPKVIAKSAVIVPVKASVITGQIAATPDNNNASPYNKASLILFLTAVLVSVAATIVAIAITSFTVSSLAFFIGLVVVGLLDLAAVLSALLSFTHNETNTDAAKIVLILNGILVLGWLITFVRQNIR